MMDGRCKTCKWWDGRNPASELDFPNGSCDLTASGDGKALESAARAVALDKESYAATLWTAPDFGCVQWEAKDTTP